MQAFFMFGEKLKSYAAGEVESLKLGELESG
ncbi:hypothetical protein SHLO109777_14020 [Shewanella loihica]